MPEKTLSTHILNKHDVGTNWEDSSYVAKSGELIVYDVDSNNASPRLKIGDGNTVTDDLPFIAAGSIYSGTLPVGTDLNTLYGNQHWGKIYWLVDTHNISNTPNSVTSGSVEIIRAGYSSTIQIFRTSTASSSSSRPTSYQRRIDDLNASDAITNWEEIVTSDGNYPNLGAGHLQEIQINTRSSDTVGWYKCGEFDVSRNTGAGDLSSSVILQVNGTNYSNYSQNAISAAPSGQIEVDTRIVGGVYNLAYSAVLVISGDITSNDFCIDTSDNGEKLNLYVNISHRYRDFKITKISEGQENVPSPNIFEFTDEYYGTSAPADAVYAVVRNNASEAETANSLTAVLLTASNDLNSIVGTDYYGKIFNWGANSVPANAPSSAAGNMIVLPHGTGTSVQYVTLDTAESGSTRPTTYQREARSGYTSDWEEIVTSNGSYPTLGAGYLQNFLVENNKGTAGKGWWKIGTIQKSSLSSQSAYSIIFLVNEVYHSAESNFGQSGVLELDAQTVSSTGITNARLNILSGYLQPEQLCLVKTTEKIELYSYLDSTYEATIWTVLSEGDESGTKIGPFESENTFYGTSAPANAVYAVVRNIASYLIDDAILNNTTVGDIGYNTDVANRTKLVTVNSIAYWNGAYQDTTSNLTYAKTPSTNSDTNEIATTAWVRDVVPGIKVNNTSSADTAAQLTTGRTVRVNLASSSAVTFNGTANITPGVTGILPVANGGTGANSLSNITVGNANQLGGVVASKYARLASPAFTGTPTAPTPSTSDDSTKIATTAWVHNQNYLTTIPSASQTVLGGVKVYTDSSGYLCIDTE